jgi:hypothetical protein
MGDTLRRIDRRTFIKEGAFLSAALSGSVRSYSQTRTSSEQSTQLSQFGYSEVQLTDGPLLDQFRHNHALFLKLDEDGLLKPFRQLTGQSAPGEDMGGWYSPSSKFDPPKDMTGYVPGHSFGQYLSGLARAYAVTGDKQTQAKVHRLVEHFAPTVTTKFYDGYCLPAYTFDKTMCGLSDAHEFAGAPTALAVLQKATDAVLPWLPEKALGREEMRARPHKNIAYTWDETYTLPENFYLAHKRGAGSRYHDLARRFLQDDTYFGPLAEGRNVLPGEHAYSHVNALCSAMQCYLSDGSKKHFQAALNGFRFAQEQSFATGGWGPDEAFTRPGTAELADSLTKTHSSFETPCGAYGHFKITRYLMMATGESTYGDSMEAVLYNTILGARPMRPDGTTFYYSDYSMNAAKSDYEQKWPCCSGTFPQLTADYGISSYFRSPKGVYVNLYVPSHVTWKQGNARIVLTQRTSYPNHGETAIHVQSDRDERFLVALRVPAWAGKQSSLKVNGKAVDAPLQPGTWARIERTWKTGDHIELSLDMPLRLAPLDERHPQLAALMRGPVALFAIEPKERLLSSGLLLAAKRESETVNHWRVDHDGQPLVFKPFAGITTERYRLYQTIA